ncbi:hypothetical protein BDF22DRAFT_410302 [Syncephalis plumigaleata]|nr:hypothetical protein BDF22DRAFT_410302 [Syncephalis plumigaleata]
MAASDQKFASAVAYHATSIDVDVTIILWSACVDVEAKHEETPRRRLRSSSDGATRSDTINTLLRDVKTLRLVEGSFAKVPTGCVVVVDRGLGQREVNLRMPRILSSAREPASSQQLTAMELHEAMLQHSGQSPSSPPSRPESPPPSIERSITSSAPPSIYSKTTTSHAVATALLNQHQHQHHHHHHHHHHHQSYRTQHSFLNPHHQRSNVESASSTVSSIEQLVHSLPTSTVHSINSLRSVTFAETLPPNFQPPYLGHSSMVDMTENTSNVAVFYTGGTDGRLALSLADMMVENHLFVEVYWYRMVHRSETLVDSLPKGGNLPSTVHSQTTEHTTPLTKAQLHINISDDERVEVPSSSTVMPSDSEAVPNDSSQRIALDWQNVQGLAVESNSDQTKGKYPAHLVDNDDKEERLLLGRLDSRIVVREIFVPSEDIVDDLISRCAHFTGRDIIIMERGNTNPVNGKIGRALGNVAAQLLRSRCQASIMVVRGAKPTTTHEPSVTGSLGHVME